MEKIRAAHDAATEPWVVLFGEVLADVFPDRCIPGGAPFNVASHLAAFGVPVWLASRLGRDALGDELRDTLARRNVGDALLQLDETHGSGRVDVIATAAGHRFEIPADQAFDHIDGDRLLGALNRLPRRPAMLYFGTLAQRNPVSRKALVGLLAASTARRFVDLNLRPPWVDDGVIAASLAAADSVKLGEEELLDVGRRLRLVTQDGDSVALGQRLQAQFGIAQLIVTRGSHGAWCLAGGELCRVPAAVTVAGGDAVGAGDAYSAVCMLGCLRDWALLVTLQRAAAFAAAICGIKGAAPAEPGFYERFGKDWQL